MWAFIVGQGSQNPLLVNDQAIVPQLHEGIVGECPFDRGPVSFQERQQVRIAHVPGGYPEQLRRASMDQEGIDEIAVFGDNDPAVPTGQINDLGIRGGVGARQIERVQHVVASPG